MLLFKAAKLAGGLRLLITEAAPLVAVSVGMLSARSAAYLVGFGLGSIGGGWLAIVATLVSVTGFFNAGANNAECEAYRAQLRAIDNANRVAIANYQALVAPLHKQQSDDALRHQLLLNDYYSRNPPNYSSCPVDDPAQFEAALELAKIDWHKRLEAYYQLRPYSGPPKLVYPRSPGFDCRQAVDAKISKNAPVPSISVSIPPPPQMLTYPACSSPNCPPGKKVWVQVLWGSPTGNFVDPKGCFIVAYSQDAPTIPANVEYNPFLPKDFVKSRATSYYLVDGDRFRGLQDKDWKNLESVQGWDKGYWKAEQTDSECRGWRPGWSRKVK
jgi:hypothetical protein